MLPNLGDVLKSFVVVEYAEFCRTEITVENFDGSNNTASFEVKGGLMAFAAQIIVVGVYDEANGAVRLFLVQDSTEAVDAHVAGKAKITDAVGHRI